MPSDDEIRKIIIKKKKRSYAIRRALARALLLIVLIVLVLPSRTSSKFDRSVMRSSVDESAKEPKIKAEAAEIYSLDLEQAVFQKNADKKIDPYSITKILTCYLVLEQADLDLNKKVKVKEDKFKDYVDGSHMMAFKDEVFTIEQLLQATLLSSANDAAYFLAVDTAGSEKKFADMMNEQVKAWGLENTHFVNSNGWKNKNHYTTAHDMAIITARCFENEKLRKLSETKEYTIPETEKSYQRNHENFFWRAVADNKNIICGKTGSWEEDDCSIALEFSEANINAVIVLLRDTMKERSNDIAKLQEHSHKVTPGFIVASNGDAVTHTRIKGGAETTASLTFDKTVIAYPKSAKNKDIKVAITTDPLEAPVPKGTKAGRYSVIVDGEELENGDLLLAEDVEKGWLLSRLYISNRSTLIGGTIVLLFLCLRLILRTLKTKSRKTKDIPLKQ